MEQNSQEWLEWRKGRITGSKLKSLIVKRGTSRKIGFYEILADRLSVEHELDNVNPMERGHLLEVEAIETFAAMTGKKAKPLDEVWVSDTHEYIAVSPDGQVSATEAVEVKCLNAAKHLQAYYEQKIPSDYEEQTVQYFVVNEKLRSLNVVFYNPGIPSLPLHYIQLQRKDLKDQIELYEAQQLNDLKTMDEMISKLTF